MTALICGSMAYDTVMVFAGRFREQILPDRIRLTLGLNDVLLIRNHDDVPQTFGPTIMMPGQSFSLPFERAASYQFVCTAHASGSLTIDVEPEPVTPWARIHWRVHNWWENRAK